MSKKYMYEVGNVAQDGFSTFIRDYQEGVYLAVGCLAIATASLIETFGAWQIATHKRSDSITTVTMTYRNGDVKYPFTAEVWRCEVVRRSPTHITVVNPFGAASVLAYDKDNKVWVFDAEHTALHNAKAA